MCSLHPLMLRSCADIRAAWREFPLTNRLGVRYEPAIDQPDEHTRIVAVAPHTNTTRDPA